jgi:predicted AAA+ superfamily ATPase
VIERSRNIAEVEARLSRNRVVAIIGARQVGKTTLAGAIARRWQGPVTRFDLEHPAEQARLQEPLLVLQDLEGLVILDEIQRLPDLFSVLRVLADRVRPATRFLLLGSASPDLLRQSSESLAGRIAYFELEGFGLDEVGEEKRDRLWIRGGFPRSFLARSDRDSSAWRRDFVRTFLERDIRSLGITVSPETLRRFWAMLAHYHGQVVNYSEFARSFGMTDSAIRNYLDILVSTFVVRRLPAFHENIGKRQVKAPKVFLSDSGILHTLLGLTSRDEIERHPKLGASWEGFGMETVIRRLGARREECHFWATYAGAELDLLVVRGGRRWGFEFKRTVSPSVTRSMRSALDALHLSELTVVHAGEESYPLGRSIRALAFRDIGRLLKPLR